MSKFKAQDDRVEIPNWIREELDAFYGYRQCVCGCKDTVEIHHLNHNNWDSERIENLIPIHGNLNWVVELDRTGSSDHKIKSEMLRIEGEAHSHEYLGATRYSYAKAYACHRLLAAFEQERANFEDELGFLSQCVRNLNRIPDTTRQIPTRYILLKSVFVRGFGIFGSKWINDSRRADFLDALASTCGDCDGVIENKSRQRIEILMRGAKALRSRYLRNNPTAHGLGKVQSASMYHLRREGHIEIAVATGKKLTYAFGKLNDAQSFFEQEEDYEGVGNVLLSKAIGTFARKNDGSNALDLLSELPHPHFQNPWNVSATISLEVRVPRIDGEGIGLTMNHRAHEPNIYPTP